MNDALPPLRVLNGAFAICSPEWSWSTIYPPLEWKGYLLWQTLTGRSEVGSSGGASIAEPGRVLLLNLESHQYEGWTTEPREMAVQWIHFVFEAPLARALPGEVEVEDVSFCEQVIQRIIRRLRVGLRSPTADRWLGALLTEMLDAQPPSRAIRGPQGPRHSALQQLCQEIEQRPAHDWSVSEMAQRMDLSATHLTRLFQRQRGCSPKQFVIRTRIRLAEHRLRLSTDTLAQIADVPVTVVP